MNSMLGEKIVNVRLAILFRPALELVKVLQGNIWPRMQVLGPIRVHVGSSSL